MTQQKNQQSKRDFAALGDFDRAMKHLVKVPKETVERREEETRTPRTPERKQ